MAQATNTTVGEILLSGDLYGDNATLPQLAPSGVTEGSYTGFTSVNPGSVVPSATYYTYSMHVDAKGRITYAKPVGTSLTVNDATTSSKGVMQVGTGLSVSAGTISIPDGTTSVRGKLQAGGGLTTTAGTLSVTWNGVPFVTTSSLGAAQAGTHLSITGGTLAVDFSNVIASADTLGTVKVGSNLNITGGGVLSHSSWANATTSTKGIMQVGDGLSVSSGVISIPDGTTIAKGKLQVGDGLSATAGVVSLNRTSYATGSVAGVVKSGWSTGVNGSGVMTLSPGWAASGYKGIVAVGSGMAVTAGQISLSEPTRLKATSGQAGIVSVPTANGLSVDGAGAVNFDASTITDATSVVKGGIIVGTGFTVSSGTLSLNQATASVYGGAKIANFGGSCFSEYSGIISIDHAGTVPLVPSIVKIGSGFSLNGSNQLQVDTTTLANATTSTKGVVQVDASNGLSVTSGTLSFDGRTASTSQFGKARSDNSTISISSGTLSFVNGGTYHSANTYALRTKGYVVESFDKADSTTITLQEDVIMTNVYLDSANANTRVLPTTTLTGNLPIGTDLYLVLQQDATGGVNFSPASVNGVTLSTAANKISIIKYTVINTNYAVPIYTVTGI